MNEHPSAHVHLMSDVETWKCADRNYFTFVILSILLGFFGVDHIYLRSFPTAIGKTVINFLTLGLWYFWDILQIVSDGDRIKKEGLNSPFDWVKGIGRGVFATPGSKEVPTARKDYVLYTILTFFGCIGADKFYIGEFFQGIVKLISCFNIFLFLFGWFWVAWDWYHAVFTIRSVITEGISAPLPYSILFDPINAKELFTCTTSVPNSNSNSDSSSFSIWNPLTWIKLPALPALSSLTSFLGPVKEFADAVIKPISGALTVANDIKQDANAVLSGTTNALSKVTDPATLSSMAQSIPSAPSVPTMPLVPTMPSMQPMPTMPTMSTMPTMPTMSTMPTMPMMKGGARSESNGVGPVLAGSLVALLAAGTAKGVYDFIRRQV